MPVLKAYVGGQWVEVSGGAGGGTGSDEVFIQPDDPITLNPLAELWYDTDAITPTSNPVAEIFYAELTANVIVSAGSPAAANTIINPGNVTYDGTPIMLEFYVPIVNVTTNSQLVFNLWDGNTDLGFIGQIAGPTTATNGLPAYIRRRITPSPGVHNFNVRAWGSLSANVTLTAGAGGPGVYAPAFLRATRVLQGGGTIAPPQSGLDANRPTAAAKYTGLRYFATDTLRDWLCDGIGWIVMYEPNQAYTPTTAGITGSSTGGNFQRSAGYIDFNAYAIISAGGVTGSVVIALPRATAGMERYQLAVRFLRSGVDNYRAMHEAMGAGATTLTVHATGGAASTGTEIAVATTPTYPWTWTINDSFNVRGRYRMNSPYL